MLLLFVAAVTSCGGGFVMEEEAVWSFFNGLGAAEEGIDEMEALLLLLLLFPF